MISLKTIFFAATATIFTTAAQAHHLCPNTNLQHGATIQAGSKQLFNSHQYDLRAGGDHAASGCNLYDRNGQQIIGYFTSQPDFEFNYSKDANYNLLFKSQTACDSVLLINDSSGNWYWDDDSAGNYDAQLYLINPAGGTFDIWVGTIGTENCDASLFIESFAK